MTGSIVIGLVYYCRVRDCVSVFNGVLLCSFYPPKVDRKEMWMTMAVNRIGRGLLTIVISALLLALASSSAYGSENFDRQEQAVQKCKGPVRMILKTYNNPSRQKVAAVKAAIRKIRPKNFGLTVPVYVVLWGVRGEKGVNKKTAIKIAKFSTWKMFPDPKSDRESRRHAQNDIINKTQRETITADLYDDTCAGFNFSQHRI